jgi:TRAP-type uncharacterized transport system fused permease subunit
LLKNCIKHAIKIVCDQETLKLILFFVIVVEYHLGMGLPTGLSASIER